MSSLLDLGAVRDLDDLVADLKRRIAARNFAEPRVFEKAAEQILVDFPLNRALVLPAGTVIQGDLQIDYDGLAEHNIGTIAALGDLLVRGRILNEDSDGGPFFFVDGSVSSTDVVKGGASFTILGSLRSSGLVFCDYNHGQLLVAGDIDTPALIINDQEVEVGGRITGRVISEETGDMRAQLVAEVFADPDDPEDDWPDIHLVRERLAAGLPVLA
jgi:hypothetical protein